MSLTESEFSTRVDEIMEQLQDAFDAAGADIDYELAGGILTLSFSKGSKIIINRQTPLRQIWVAAKSGGYHFDFDPHTDTWRCDSNGKELFAALSEYCSAQAGKKVTLEPA